MSPYINSKSEGSINASNLRGMIFAFTILLKNWALAEKYIGDIVRGAERLVGGMRVAHAVDKCI